MTNRYLQGPCAFVLLLLLFFVTFASMADEPALQYKQHENVVFAEVHGVGLLLDVFQPKGQRNGLAIIDVVSGAFHSDRGKVEDHKKARVFDTLCNRGYTVFAVRPGSITKFSGPEMLKNVRRGVAWVIEHAQQYEIDGERLGLMGASAGGYLACLTAVTAKPGNPTSRIKAAGVFFPPTDLLQYGGTRMDVRSAGRLSGAIRRLLFREDLDKLDEAQIEKRLEQYSPARRVTSSAPPFMLIHGDADFVVPLQQSQAMIDALKAADVPAELVVKQGGGHPWPTIHEEVGVLADWFDKTLASVDR